MRGYYGYKRRNRLPVFVIGLVILLGLGFAGMWGWMSYTSVRETPVTADTNAQNDDSSRKIDHLVASNDISEGQ